MMKKTILVGLCAASLMCSCSDDWGVESDGKGYIFPVVGLDTEVISSTTTQANSRAAEGEVTVDELSLRLIDSEGNVEWVCDRFGDFDPERQFPIGSYTIEAYYGKADKEGFNSPYYYASSAITIADKQTTPVSLNAKLANSMVSIVYTDDFKDYMKMYAATVKGAGDAISFTQEETRPAYVSAGNVTVSLYFVRPNDDAESPKVITLDPIQAEARHHYTITFGVDKGIGNASLTVSFDESLQQEDVEIDLSDKVFSAPAPSIETVGFDSTGSIDFVAGLVRDGKLQMNLTAYAGFKTVTLETTSQSLIAQGWPATIDLLAATEEQKTTLTGLGLSVLGLWNSEGNMAVLDFSSVLTKVKAVEGSNLSTFKVSVVDAISRPTAAPAILNINARPVELELSKADNFTSGQDFTVNLKYNGDLLDKNVKFEYKNANSGNYIPLTISSYSKTSDGNYQVVLTDTPEVDKDLVVRATAADAKSEITIALAPFQVTVNDYDVYATRAYVNIAGVGEVAAPSIDAAEFWAKKVGEQSYYKPAQERAGNYVQLTGLTPATNYLVRVKVDDLMSQAVAFTTEAATQLANSDMEEWTSTAIKSNCVLWEAAGWQTFNGITMSQVNDGGNYSYCSTSGTKRTDDAASGSYAAVVRTVGWGSGNSAAGVGGGGLSRVKRVTRGELFLGKWNVTSFNAGSIPEYGIAFASRPSALSFKYKFSVHNKRNGAAVVTVLDASNNILAQNSFEISAQDSYVTKQLPLTFGQGIAKAAKISVVFRSCADTDVTLERSDIYQGSTLNSAEHVGSQLYVDDIELIY